MARHSSGRPVYPQRRGPSPLTRTAWGHPMFPGAPVLHSPATHPAVAAAGGGPVNPQIAWQTPTSAPPGTYDPALDAQGENANLGYEWAGQDYTLGNQQRLNDLNGDPTYGTAGALAGIQHNYDTQLAGTNKQFANLAASQADAQARAGADLGGAAAQAADKRQGNWRTIVGQLDYGRDQAVASARQAFDRANSAADTTYQRAGTTNTLFGTQLGAEKVYAAQQAGLLPTMPPNALTHQGPANIGRAYQGRYRGRLPARGRHY